MPRPPDWQALAEQEATLAARIRQAMARAPNDPQWTALDALGRTPLMQAALHGQAEIVKALLTSAKVRATLETRDALDATAWQLAQFARPMTWLTCYPLHLASEALPNHLRDLLA